MAGQAKGAMEDQASQMADDPWAAAFAALDQVNKKDPEGDAAAGQAGDDGAGGEGGTPDPSVQAAQGADDGASDAAGSETRDSAGDAADTGGLGADAGAAGLQDGDDGGDLLGVTEEFVREYQDGLVEDIRDRAISEIAQEFIKRGIRNTNGKLGASLNDPDICKRDEDGVPRFYNPDTGREFTGDNPRRQAQEWVDDYNNELAASFNQACSQYERKLVERVAPNIAVLEFASTYEKLDPIRQKMFDNVVEDYEITDDNGEVIGYSCDLNQAKALVDRQVEAIQAYAKEHAPSQEVPNAQPGPSGPAIDMKNSAGAAQTAEDKPASSLEEAMLRIQNRQLEDMRKKG